MVRVLAAKPEALSLLTSMGRLWHVYIHTNIHTENVILEGWDG